MLDIKETGSKSMAVVPATKGSLTSFDETRSDKWPVCHCFGAKKLLPVYGKPEVVIAELLDGYNMVYNVVVSTECALWAVIFDQ